MHVSSAVVLLIKPMFFDVFVVLAFVVLTVTIPDEDIQ